MTAKKRERLTKDYKIVFTIDNIFVALIKRFVYLFIPAYRKSRVILSDFKYTTNI